MTSLLGQGWKHVDSFDGIDEEEYEDEEVSYVTFDLGVAPPGFGESSVSSYRLIGLDTSTPYLQLGNSIFKGEHQTLIGTEILLRDVKDLAARSEKHVKPIATTQQRVRFREVMLRPKKPDDEVHYQDLLRLPGPSSLPLSISGRQRNRGRAAEGDEVPSGGRRGRGRSRGRGRGRGKGKGRAADENAEDAEQARVDALPEGPMDYFPVGEGLPPLPHLGFMALDELIPMPVEDGGTLSDEDVQMADAEDDMSAIDPALR